jgi:hypothetical protein
MVIEGPKHRGKKSSNPRPNPEEVERAETLKEKANYQRLKLRRMDSLKGGGRN